MAFSISPTAVEVIRRRIERSSVDRPIAGMVDTSESLPVSREMGEALRRNAGSDELRKLAKREYSPHKMKFHLSVGVYSKSQHPSWMHTSIDGIEFVLPFWARWALRKWTLDFVNNRFLLRSGDRVKYTLTDR